MKFRPLHDRVVVRRIEGEDKTKGGIIIPDTAKEKPQEGARSSPSWPGSRARDESGKLSFRFLTSKRATGCCLGKMVRHRGQKSTERISWIMKEVRRHGRDRGYRAPRRKRRPDAPCPLISNHGLNIMSAKDVRFLFRRARPNAARRRYPQ